MAGLAFDDTAQISLGVEFSKHYILMKPLFLNSAPNAKRRNLGGVLDRRCRYCRKPEPLVTFKNRSHAIPAQLGNKILFDNLECDTCNAHFGKYLEDGFAKFINPYLAFFRTRGRVGIPTHNDKELRVATVDNGLKISLKTAEELDRRSSTGSGLNIVTFVPERQAYYPSSVLKTFIKIGLALMPDSESFSADHLLFWLLEESYDPLYSGVDIIQWSLPGPLNPNLIRGGLYKARPEFWSSHFNYILVLTVGNLQFQIIIPAADEAALPKSMLIAPVFRPPGYAKYGDSVMRYVDLTSAEQIFNEKVEVRIAFSSVEEI
ncbi:HNH endonuclease [Pseudomonas syringae]|nr:HNH endonuclease [Pseudomonas syringae]MCQ3029400.1 HNH endonuclease [Pseudomonas syringae]MDG6398831.1 HNH endonuclease [Pseudomonas quasicaspiana]